MVNSWRELCPESEVSAHNQRTDLSALSAGQQYKAEPCLQGGSLTVASLLCTCTSHQARLGFFICKMETIVHVSTSGSKKLNETINKVLDNSWHGASVS